MRSYILTEHERRAVEAFLEERRQLSGVLAKPVVIRKLESQARRSLPCLRRHVGLLEDLLQSGGNRMPASTMIKETEK